LFLTALLVFFNKQVVECVVLQVCNQTSGEDAVKKFGEMKSPHSPGLSPLITNMITSYETDEINLKWKF